MYYVIKFIQAAGLTLILFAFIKSFPELMDRKILVSGIVVFTFGWILERILLRK